MSDPVCRLCGNYAVNVEALPGPSGGILDTSRVRCSTCGTYEITREAAVNFRRAAQEDRYRLQAITRTASERGEIVLLTTENVDSLPKTTPQPSPVEQMNLVLEYLAAKAVRNNQAVRLDPRSDYPVAYANGPGGLGFLTKSLANKGFIVRTDQSEVPHYQIHMAGYEYLEERKRERRTSSANTGWPKVDRALGEIRKRLEEATTEEQFTAVCHLCGQTLISLAEAVHDPTRHPVADGTEVSPTDAKRRLEAFLAVEMGGPSRSEERRIARAAIEFALEAVRSADSAKHDRNADRRLALYCAEATALVVRLVEIAAGKRDH